MSSDNQFTALGPAAVGFQTTSTNINEGAVIAGNSVGIVGSCSKGNGVVGQSASENDSGVWGNNTGGGYGVGGSTNGGLAGPGGPKGIVAGVWGSNSGQGAGVRGTNSNGDGVFGEGKLGVHGQSSSAVDSGVLGENSAGGIGISGLTLGGQSQSAGVLGYSYNAGGVAVGVHGVSSLNEQNQQQGDGVLGVGKNGVHGISSSANDSGVWGENNNGGFGVGGSTRADTGPRGAIAGVWGSNSGNGPGVRGTGGTGVLGEGFIGVHGISTTSSQFLPGIGVQAEHTAGGVGLWASCTGGPGFAVVALAPQGIGITAEGGLAPLRLTPATVPGKPLSGDHSAGELYVDSNGALYFCVTGGKPGIWKNVQLV
jgi:hypothetical protein